MTPPAPTPGLARWFLIILALVFIAGIAIGWLLSQFTAVA